MRHLFSRRARRLRVSMRQRFEEDAPHTHDLVGLQYGVKSVFVKGDVTLESTWEEIKAQALALTGRIDMCGFPSRSTSAR